jgi:dephospho-CoA kinase
MKVILLLGSSSAGKSTLCDALVREHGWYTHGCDQVGEILRRERTPILHRGYGKYLSLKAFINKSKSSLCEI